MITPLAGWMMLFGQFLPKPAAVLPPHRSMDMSNAPRVTPTDIQAKIRAVGYLYDGRLTICVLTLENGTKVTGESACVSEANYNQAISEQVAYKEAFEKVWPLEGYLLRQKLFDLESAA